MVDGAEVSARLLSEGVTLHTPGDISAHSEAPAYQAVRDAYRKWFGDRYDLDALTCVLAAAAAERLDGDPVWLLLVGGSGAAKTETVVPLVGAKARVVSTISGEAALLSGTPRKQKAKNATGGLLQQMGRRGLLVIKDVTSILSMNRDTRALVLAALREIYDGAWSRNIGTDGGMTLEWSGRLVIIGAVTTAWDAAHSVIATMGDRFVLVRLSDAGDDRKAASRRAMANVGSETEMRGELAKVVGELLDSVDPADAIDITDEEAESLLQVADLVTRARTAVERDFNGNPEWPHALEMPTRFAKQLVQVLRGAVAIGVPRGQALAVALRCAHDSMPPLRLRVLADVADHPRTLHSHVATRLQVSRRSCGRTLDELQMLGLLHYDDNTRWSVVAEHAPALAAVRRNVTTHVEDDDECAEMSLPLETDR